jgi:trigger factor
MGVQPDRLARELSERGQLASVAADVLRGKALTLLAERATVTDESGRPVDVKAAAEPPEDAAEEAAEDTGSAGEDEDQADQEEAE